MKRFQVIASLLLVLCLLLSVTPTARAESDDERFAGKSWDEIMEEFFQLYQVRAGYCGFGYKNLVTGEEHYHNGDMYLVTASMYKVPLNMIYADMVSKGELDWDTPIYGLPYETLMEGSIIDSNNAYAESLWLNIGNGSYRTYREIMAPYVGEDAATVDPKYYENNFHTPRQIIYALSLLYDNPDRFPRILDTMKRAEPENYFRYGEKRFEIAQKYGFLQEEFHTYVNDCGIVYTDEPIALVVFTDNTPMVMDMLTAYCTLMCDYAQYHAAEHRAMDKAMTAAAEGVGLSLTVSPAYEGSAEAAQTAAGADQGSPELFSFIGKAALAVLALLVLAGLMAAARSAGSRVLTVILGLLCALALAAAGLVNTSSAAVFHMEKGGNAPAEGPGPQAAAEAFFDDLESQNYAAALERLQSYSSLGLENDADNAADQAALTALRQSFSHEFTDEASISGRSAAQPVRLSYLDLDKLNEAYIAETRDTLRRMFDESGGRSLLESDGSFKAEAVRQAADTALNSVLSHTADYRSSVDTELSLVKRSGQWFLVGNDALDTALSGGRL